MKAALEFFNKAILYDKSNTKALKNRGNTLAKLERFQEAKADYFKILDILPNDGGTMMNLGNIMHQTGEVEKACQYWQKALNNGYNDAQKMITKYCKK
ncbi:MAG: hypothetical protein PF590_07375 [Candidatus Delongbacteria bacterium]|jgi:tetratricopeptide (TPR) repeat protein|nr:hypothetical protein [Candidatus Delongbacteria bacterium]